MSGKNYKKFIENKERRDAFIREITEVINGHFASKGDNRRLNAEDLIRNADDPKKIETFIKCNERLEKNEALRDYSIELENKYDIKIAKGFNRHIHFALTLPSKDDPNKDEIEKKNVEILKKYTEENKKEIIRNDFITLFTCDKTKFFPRNVDEALESYEKDPLLYNTGYIIQSEIENNGLTTIDSFTEGGYDYYRNVLEQGANLGTCIEHGASEFSLFMPADLDIPDLTILNAKVKSVTEKYSDIVAPGVSYTHFQSFSVDKIMDGENQKKMRDFFEEHDQDHMFMINHTIGGTNFRDQIVEGKTEIKPGFSNLIYNFYNGYQNDTQKFLKSVGTLERLVERAKSEKIDLKKEAKVAFNNRTGIVSDPYKPILGLCVAYARLTNDQKESIDFLKDVDELVKKGEITSKEIDNYVEFFNKGYEPMSVEKISEKGIEFVNFEPKKSDDPNKDFINQFMALKAKADCIKRSPYDRHFEKDLPERIIEYSNISQDLRYYKNKACEELGIDKNISDSDFIKQVTFNTKQLPKDFIKGIEPNKDEAKIRYLSIDKFDELKGQFPNEIDKLASIKENLIAIDNSYTSNLMNVENPYEKASLTNTNLDPFKNYVKKDPSILTSFDIMSRDTNPQLSMEKDPEVTKKLASSKFSLSDKTKENILKISEKMKELKIFDVDDIDPELAENGEQSKKVYGYQKYNTKRIELVKAIEEKDLDKSYKISQEIDKIKGNYKELFNLITKTFPQDGCHIPGNLSTCRNSNIPLEISSNHQAQSQMNGVYIMMLYCHKNNIKLEDLLSNPEKYMREGLKEKQDRGLKKYSENALGQQMRDMLAVPDVDPGNLLFGRSFETMAALETDQKIVDKNGLSIIYLTSAIASNELGYGYLFEKQNGESLTDTEPDFESVRDYMAFGDKYPITNFMNNAYDLSKGEYFKKEYDYAKELKEDKRSTKEIYESVMNKLTALQEDYFIEREYMPNNKRPDYFISGALLYFNDLMKERQLDPTVDKDAVNIKKFLDDPKRSIVEELQKIDPERYPADDFHLQCQYKDAYMNADKAKNDVKFKLSYFNRLHKGIDGETLESNIQEMTQRTTDDLVAQFDNNRANYKEHLKENIQITLTLQERHDSRSIFGKIFRPSAWRERRIMRENRDLALANGMSENQYEEMFNTERDETVNERIARNLNSIESKNKIADIIQRENEPINNEPERRHIEVNELDVSNEINESVIEDSKSKNLEINKDSKQIEVNDLSK